MSDPVLLPCPFCGGPAQFEEMPQGSSTKVLSCTWSVGCANSEIDCIGYMLVAHYNRKSEAADAWNKRAPRLPIDIVTKS